MDELNAKLISSYAVFKTWVDRFEYPEDHKLYAKQQDMLGFITRAKSWFLLEWIHEEIAPKITSSEAVEVFLKYLNSVNSYVLEDTKSELGAHLAVIPEDIKAYDYISKMCHGRVLTIGYNYGLFAFLLQQYTRNDNAIFQMSKIGSWCNRFNFVPLDKTDDPNVVNSTLILYLDDLYVHGMTTEEFLGKKMMEYNGMVLICIGAPVSLAVVQKYNWYQTAEFNLIAKSKSKCICYRRDSLPEKKKDENCAIM